MSKFSLLMSLVFTSSAIFVLNACSVQKTADDIRDTSKDIKNESEYLGKRTDDLEFEVSKSQSYTLFDEQIDKLFGAESYVPTSEDAKLNPEPDLLLYGGATIESLWFQYWKGDYNDTLSALDESLRFSSEILLARSIKHVPRTFMVNIKNPDRSYKAIASLGAKLDHTAERFDANIRKFGLKQISLYDVFLMALQNRDVSQPKVLFPKAVNQILQYRQEAIYMLQLRHNYLPMMVVGRISDLQDRGLPGRLLMRFGASPKIDLNESGFTYAELKEWTSWLKNAVSTRKSLKEMGIPPEYNSMFAGIVRNVDFGQQELLAQRRPLEVSIAQAQYDFARAYMDVVDDSNAALYPQASPQAQYDAARAYMEAVNGGNAGFYPELAPAPKPDPAGSLAPQEDPDEYVPKFKLKRYPIE